MQKKADAMDMEKSASRFKTFRYSQKNWLYFFWMDTAKKLPFFVKMWNWHIKNENFY